MTTPREIIDAYKRHEREAGGPFLADIQAVLRKTAEELRVSEESVRATMLDEWTGGVSG